MITYRCSLFSVLWVFSGSTKKKQLSQPKQCEFLYFLLNGFALAYLNTVTKITSTFNKKRVNKFWTAHMFTLTAQNIHVYPAQTHVNMMQVLLYSTRLKDFVLKLDISHPPLHRRSPACREAVLGLRGAPGGSRKNPEPAEKQELLLSAS